MNTTERIREYVATLPLCKPVTSQAFMEFGSRAAVDQALTRLVKEKVLSRVARGVYVRPKTSRYVGEVPPEPIQVAEAIAAETGSVIQIHGAEAARRMGLSTQVPARPIFYTSGPSRCFALGQMEVLLKHVCPRKLALSGRPAGIALTALWYLGKTAVTLETIAHIGSQLPQGEFEALCASTRCMPGWMHDVFLKFKATPRHA